MIDWTGLWGQRYLRDLTCSLKCIKARDNKPHRHKSQHNARTDPYLHRNEGSDCRRGCILGLANLPDLILLSLYGGNINGGSAVLSM